MLLGSTLWAFGRAGAAWSCCLQHAQQALLLPAAPIFTAANPAAAYGPNPGKSSSSSKWPCQHADSSPAHACLGNGRILTVGSRSNASSKLLPRPGCTVPWLLQQRRSMHSTAALHSKVIAFPLAQTGEGISECELIQWFVKEGENVKQFDKLCEVQSDKASVEITSRFDGVIRKLLHSKGDVVKVGATLIELEVAAETSIPPDLEAFITSPDAGKAKDGGRAADSAGTGPNPASSSAAGAAAAQQSSHDVLEHVTQQQGLHVDMAPPASTPTSRAAGKTASSAAAEAAAVGNTAAHVGERAVLASPSVRRMARDMGVALVQVPGTGPQGRISKEDLLRFVENSAGAAAAAAGAAPTHPPSAPEPVSTAPSIPRPPPQATSQLPLRGYRRAMVKSMNAVANVPHFHLHDEAQVDVVTAVRKAMARDLSLHGAKLTLLPFIIKAVSLMLLDHSLLNASLAADQASITLHGSHNIGVAMATPNGLVVPNIKQVESLSVVQIAREVTRLQAAAASNKLSTEDITGGTITVSNIGSIGGLFANPLVNPPEVAILAVGRVRPVASPGDRHLSSLPTHPAGSTHILNTPPAGIQHVVGLSWGADHRVVDGAALAGASNAVKAYLEAPERMLIRLS